MMFNYVFLSQTYYESTVKATIMTESFETERPNTLTALLPNVPERALCRMILIHLFELIIQDV